MYFYKDNFFADKAQKIYHKNAANGKAFYSFCGKSCQPMPYF